LLLLRAEIETRNWRILAIAVRRRQG
jgi:hypothetical protein